MQKKLASVLLSKKAPKGTHKTGLLGIIHSLQECPGSVRGYEIPAHPEKQAERREMLPFHGRTPSPCAHFIHDTTGKADGVTAYRKRKRMMLLLPHHRGAIVALTTPAITPVATAVSRYWLP